MHETAYEHWHRMLFARFLAENELLIEPESGVPVSLSECEELASERGEDPWEAAGRWASGMLPEIFRPGDPVLAVQLPPETNQTLRKLLAHLPAAVFTADDSLGWTYQYWQAERKDAVNKSGVKIGADELPAVTQLFTERYMVLFLLHNTIGAWRAGQVLARMPGLTREAKTEDQLREAVRLRTGGGYDFSYLRFVRKALEGEEEDTPTGPWRPAAGSFERWPRTAAKLRVLDPCCGSGHFLVETFHLLVRLRMEEESLAVADAVRAVLRDNLFGLELDPRCTQIAAFNVALAAWKLIGDPIELPPPQIACSGLAPNSTREEWLHLADAVAMAGGIPADRDLLGPEDNLLSAPVRESLGELHALFEQAPVLGSLIDPRASSGQGDVFRTDYGTLRPLLSEILARDVPDPDLTERAIAARGMAHAAQLLGDTYTLVITNVPYLARGKQSEQLRRFCESHHADAKGDIATAFVSRFFRWLGEHGTQAVVTPQNWLFLTTYRKLRERLLRDRTWNVVARLGPGAFETITGHVVNVALNILSANRPRPEQEMGGIDVSGPRGQRPIKAQDKAQLLAGVDTVVLANQAEQLDNPDAVILMRPIGHTALMRSLAHGVHGFGSKDSPRFFSNFWETSLPLSHDWQFLQSTVRKTLPWGGCEQVVYWQGGRGVLADRAKTGLAIPAGRIAWGRTGIAVSQMGLLPCALYAGDIFDKNVAVISPRDESHLPGLWCFCASPEYAATVREIDQKLNVTNVTLVKIPFDLDRWQQVAENKYPNGLPEPYSDDPTQWIFHGDPGGSVVWDEEEKWTVRGSLRIDDTVLQVAVARLLGYRWPAELDPEMRLAKEQRELVEYCKEFARFADADGIVCLSPTRGEATAADRVRRLLAAAYDDEWSPSAERALLAATSEKPPASLEDWLRDRFFYEHCRLFHNRPFIWHIWDGRKDGFHALVNYHRLAGADGEGRRTLETVTYSYLSDWIARQRQAQREGLAGADARLVAALELRAQLEEILEGERPYDIFVRWKTVAEQPAGWNPDINDGVRLNIRPFMRAELRSGGRKGAGILRAKPNIKWGKDRGKEPQELRDREDFSWFWSCPGTGTTELRTDYAAEPGAAFDGNRWNDLHYTLAAKRAAREAAAAARREEKDRA
ncbi:N-6 DNA methylase [Candidatus Palauibacter sp.]|uniref:N-6 DNA methylase n=1 Tax=Candidatus Palauibacter sp. TaxID=3101350 RepID=UPI003C702FE1